jgi:tetratricopeptide repeat protein
MRGDRVKSWTRRERAVLAAILGLAVLVRLAVHAELADYVLYRVPLVDAEEYVEWGSRLAQGGGEPADVYYKPPLYPHVLGWAMRIGGPGVGTALFLNGALGVLNVWLFALWTRRLASPTLALIAAAAAAVYGPFLYFEAQALPTTLGITLGLAALLALLACDARPVKLRLAGAGLACGLLVLLRPSFAPAAAAACIWLAFRPAGWRGAASVALVACLTVLPITIRNRVQGGAWVPVSANGGINFFLGNNADAKRTAALSPGLEWEELVRRIPAAERRGQARWDRYFARQAWGWVRAAPGDFVAGLGRKTLEYLNSHEIDRNLDARGFRARSRVLRWAPRYAWLCVGLLLGLAVAWRSSASGRLAGLYWAACAAAVVLVFVSERYKVDAAPAALPAALLGMAEIVAHARRRQTCLRARSAWLWVALGAALAFNDVGGIRRLHPAQAAVLEGVAYYKEGRNADAVRRLQQALDATPDDPDAHYQLATALQKLNRDAEALQEFEAAGRLVPGNPKPSMGAGWILRRLGRFPEALERYERAAAADPDNPLVHLETAALLEQMGRLESARDRYTRAAALSEDPEIRRTAAAALARLGHASELRR